MTLGDLAAMLREQQARKVDIVAPAAAIRAAHGQLVIDGTDPVLGPDGVTASAGTYIPTEVCDQGLADKLGIPGAYLRKLREQRPELYDANVNGWLDGDWPQVPDPLPAARHRDRAGGGAGVPVRRVQADRQPRRAARRPGRGPGVGSSGRGGRL